MRAHDVLAQYGVLRDEHLRSLRRLGLIAGTDDADDEARLDFADLAVVRRLAQGLRDGRPVKDVLRELRAWRDGQLVLDFRAPSEPAPVVPLRTTPSASLPWRDGLVSDAPDQAALDGDARSYFLVAASLDDGSPEGMRQAGVVYRQALAADPALVPALINLANVHYEGGEHIEALALYERAVRLDPGVFEGHFNLGNIYHDLKRYPEAEESYRKALALNDRFADAHLYLAVVLEKTGQSARARPHWRQYLALEPCGEWASLARDLDAEEPAQ